MPPASFLRKRVVDLLRPQRASTVEPDDLPEGQREEEDPSGFSLLAHLYLTGLAGQSTKTPELYFGKTGCDLPLLQIEKLDKEVIAACTGPDGGLTTVDGVREQRIARVANLDDEMTLSTDGMDTEDEEEERRESHHRGSSFSLGPHPISGLPVKKTPCDEISWDAHEEEAAFGCSVSLYERNPLTGVAAGTPIADVYAVCARANNAILALADGVNWGEGARLAARCAIRGAMDHLNKCIDAEQFSNTNEVFHALLASFHTAHALILQEGGQLTTLCVALALPVAGSNSWVLCTCNVGDSLCFVYNNSYGVREVTLGSHDASEMRDMRNAGGALGPVDGRNPQLQNLTCSESFVEPGDVIFITSDGISDNFDPVVGKFCVIKRSEDAENTHTIAGLPRVADRKLSVTTTHSTVPASSNGKDFHRTRTCAASIPCVDAVQRQHLMLLRMRDIITHGFWPIPRKEVDGEDATTPVEGPTMRSPRTAVTPFALCTSLVQFATQLSAAKRRTLENPELYKKEKLTKAEERARRRNVRERIAELPGKLDHASVVAYRVGVHSRTARRRGPPKEWKPPQEDSPEGESLPVENLTTAINLENFARLQKASCYKTIVDAKGDFASASLSLKIVPVEEKKAEEPSSPRATSPYEEIRVLVAPSAQSARHRRGHERGSAGRHTLGVDIAWLKQLVTRKEGREKEKLDEEAPRSIGKRLRGFLGSSKNVASTSTPPSEADVSASSASSAPPLPRPRPIRGVQPRPHSTAHIPPRLSFRTTASVSNV